MTEGTEIVPQGQSKFAVMPVMDIEAALERRQAIVKFVASIMEEGRDYGTIPGTDKPTLLKPGAEKLTTFFGLSPQFPLIGAELDWTGEHHGGEPFFYFQYKCQLFRGDLLVGEGNGSCNSWEKKYRYRSAALVCPNCGQETVIKGKEEYGGGWLCWAKKGGCGTKWSDGAEEIEGQEQGQIKNENPQDLVNTIDKMAQKRALIAATLIAVNASEFFTQDLEDLPSTIIEGTVREIEDDDASETTAVRPYSAEKTRDRLRQSAIEYTREIAEGMHGEVIDKLENYRGAVLANLEKCFVGDTAATEKRHSILMYIWGTDSTKTLTPGQILAHRKHLDWKQDSGGDWYPSAIAIQEVQVMCAARMAELGQEELPIDAGDQMATAGDQHEEETSND